MVLPSRKFCPRHSNHSYKRPKGVDMVKWTAEDEYYIRIYWRCWNHPFTCALGGAWIHEPFRKVLRRVNN